MADASSPVPRVFGAGLLAGGWLRKPRPKAINSSFLLSDLLGCSYAAGDLCWVFGGLCGLGFPGPRGGANGRWRRVGLQAQIGRLAAPRAHPPPVHAELPANRHNDLLALGRQFSVDW